MSAIAAIAIQDGQGTPVTHTFNAIKSGENCFWREAQSALPLIGQGTIATASSGRADLQKVTVTMDLPALETITAANAQGYTAAPKVAYSNKAKLEFFLPSRGTAAQRKDLRVLLRNLLNDDQIIDLVENLVTPN